MLFHISSVIIYLHLKLLRFFECLLFNLLYLLDIYFLILLHAITLFYSIAISCAISIFCSIFYILRKSSYPLSFVFLEWKILFEFFLKLQKCKEIWYALNDSMYNIQIENWDVTKTRAKVFGEVDMTETYQLPEA